MLIRTLNIGGVLVASFVYSAVALAAQPAADPLPGGDVVAKVDGEAIARAEFEAALVRSARQRFYHGKVEEARMVELKKEVLDGLVLERLLAKEADRRGVKPDLAEVDGKIAELDARYKTSEQWAAQRAQVLPEMRARMMANSRMAVLEQTVKAQPSPSEAEVRKFYDANHSLFTEPQQDRVAVILLKVDPSSTRDVWDSAKAEADRIRAKLMTGASFGDLAKLHSGDDSAQNDGDMGYLHHGMLAPEAQAAVDAMKVGDLSEPIELLQGYALFKLLDRKPAKLRTFDQVKQRASDLLVRKKGDEAWEKLTDTLKKTSKIWVDPTVAASK